LSAQVTGLFPNATITAHVRVHNSQQYRLTVQTASVTVDDASSACRHTNVTARMVASTVDVAARADAFLPIELHMVAGAPDACIGASFPLIFDATGVLDETARPRKIPFTGIGSFTIALALVGLLVAFVGIALLTAARRGATSP
jgi:hypothetical protein